MTRRTPTGGTCSAEFPEHEAPRAALLRAATREMCGSCNQDCTNLRMRAPERRTKGRFFQTMIRGRTDLPVRFCGFLVFAILNNIRFLFAYVNFFLCPVGLHLLTTCSFAVWPTGLEPPCARARFSVRTSALRIGPSRLYAHPVFLAPQRVDSLLFSSPFATA